MGSHEGMNQIDRDQNSLAMSVRIRIEYLDINQNEEINCVYA